MDISTHFLLLEILTLKLITARRTNKQFKNLDIQQTMKEYFETNRDLIQSIEFTPYHYQQQKKLLPYITKLVNHLSEEELTLLNERLKTAKIKDRRLNILFGLMYGGLYDAKKNRITYFHKKSIGHELIHLASSYYDEQRNLILCGFKTYDRNNKLIFGVGLNEGYTELLASRIFNKKNKIRSYKGLVKICRMIELFFDDPIDMRKLFFSCNVMGLIEKLKEYMPEEEVYATIYDLDNDKHQLVADSPSLRRIEGLLYRRFMDKCTDENKRREMESILGTNPIKKASIEHYAEQISGATASRNVQTAFKDRLKGMYKGVGVVAIAYASLVGLDLYKNNITVPFNNANELIENAKEDNTIPDTFLNFDTDKFLLFYDGEIVESYEGEYLAKALIEHDIKCCQIGNRFYTSNGCDMIINTYKLIKQIKMGNMITYQATIITQKVLADGTVIDQDDITESYDSIELIDTQIIKTVPYESLAQQQLTCNYEGSYDEFGDLTHIDDVSYTLKLKKN